LGTDAHLGHCRLDSALGHRKNAVHIDTWQTSS